MSTYDLRCAKAVSKINFSQNVDSHRFVRRIFKIETTKHPRTLNQDLHLPRPYFWQPQIEEGSLESKTI